MPQVFWGQPQDDPCLEEEAGCRRPAFGGTGSALHPSQACAPHDHGSPHPGLHPAAAGGSPPFRQGKDQTSIGPALPKARDPLTSRIDHWQDHQTPRLVLPEEWPGLSRSRFKMGGKPGKKTPATHTGALRSSPHRRRPLADGYDGA